MSRAEAISPDRPTSGGGLTLARVPTRLQPRYWLRVNSVRVALAVAVLVIWELGSGPLWSAFWVSKPSLIGQVLWRWLSTGQLFRHVLVTFQEMAIGFMLGVLLGGVLGFVFGARLGWYRVAQPFIDAFYTMPKLALGPLLIMWFGIGIGPKIALITLMVFFFVFMNTFTGVRSVDPELVSIVRIMGASRWDVYRMVIIPSALTSILVGLKISIPYALLGAIIGELLVGDVGLGYLLNYAGGTQDTKSLFAALAVTAVVAMAVNGALVMFERRALRWKPSELGRG